MSDKKKNKIIMVNSFKGGTGKTSVALAQCVHNWRTKNTYDNIYFLDIDRLGTSLAYILLPESEKANIHYLMNIRKNHMIRFAMKLDWMRTATVICLQFCSIQWQDGDRIMISMAVCSSMRL